MKILLITNLFPPLGIGGYEMCAFHICNRLRDYGHLVHVLTSDFHSSSAPLDEKNVHRLLRLNGDYPVNSRNRWNNRLGAYYFDVKNYYISRRMIQRLKPDVVYAFGMHYLSVSPLLAGRIKGIPVVFHLMDKWLKYLWEMGAEGRIHHRVLRIIKQSILKRLDFSHIIYASDGYRKLYSSVNELFSYGKVIPYGLDIEKFPLKSSFLKKNGIPRFLFVGRIDREKNIETLLKAAGMLRRKTGMPFNLSIIGCETDKTYMKNLLRICESEDILREVEFTGEIPYKKIQQHYQQADVFILPSMMEAFPGVILEAEATGLPVIASNVGGIPEMIQDGETGFLFTSGNVDELCNKMMYFYDHPEMIKSMGLKGRKFIQENYLIESQVRKMEEYLKNAISGKS